MKNKLLLDDSAVGKTSLISKYANDEFIEDYMETKAMTCKTKYESLEPRKLN